MCIVENMWCQLPSNRRAVIELRSIVAPAAKSTETANLSAMPSDYTIEYTNYGKIAERQLLMLEQRYPALKVDQYVIMPNHIHVIFILRDLTEVNPNLVKWNLNSAGVNPRPTVGDGEEIRVNPCPTVENGEETGVIPRPTIMDIVCTYKSLTTRECKKLYPIKKLFQTSFYDHIIRDKEDYNEIVKYIHKNPMLWRFDDLFENEKSACFGGRFYCFVQFAKIVVIPKK